MTSSTAGRRGTAGGEGEREAGSTTAMSALTVVGVERAAASPRGKAALVVVMVVVAIGVGVEGRGGGVRRLQSTAGVGGKNGAAREA